MKQCPRCNRAYTDETLSYCLDDGTVLIKKYDPDATQIAPFLPADNPPPTTPYIAPPHSVASSAPAPQPRKGFSLWVIGLLVLGALVVGLSIGAYLFQSYNLSSAEGPSVSPTPNDLRLAKATPTPATPTPTPTPRPTATPIATSSPSVVQSTPEPERTCVLYNDKSDMVRVRENCDTQDCDTDASTIAGEYPVDTPIRVITGSSVRGAQFTWVKVVIISSGRAVWVASSKTKCN